MSWKFWIDVGGTFTDVVAVRPDGKLLAHKILSSGRIKGRVTTAVAGDRFTDPQRSHDPQRLYDGFILILLSLDGRENARAGVASFDAASGTFILNNPLNGLAAGMNYELISGEPAPVVAIRHLMGLPLAAEIGEIEVRLGTTRGTNALLERKGAPTAYVTTRGFGDMLHIGTQERPSLFELNIRKPEVLFKEVVELDERIDANGNVLEALDPAAVERALSGIKSRGIESLAVCLMNSYRNQAHERIVEGVARALKFEHVSISADVSPTIKLVTRGETTVMDAYLTPVIKRYINEIRACMPHARLRLMTSAGGLSSAESFSGKDSILSGPAGGVVGFSNVARAAGFEKAIGFDMGGTSTDVSRFDSRYEYQFETQKAGVRVALPILAVETVAAGGGSICAFDGQKLRVGPESSGADPGPACYGRGGPLSITDIDVFLGKILPDTFPFPLDVGAIDARLDALASAVFAEIGKRLSRRELAEGFYAIANANMAAPIKSISIARGYDLRDYCLVCFGGAGGQHACAIARILGMARVLIHPYAGVLSAYGIGLADVKKIAERTLLAQCGVESAAAMLEEFGRMERNLRLQLRDEGIAEAGIKPSRRLLEMRYAGQSASLTIELCESDAETIARAAMAAFEQQHRQLNGYVIPGRAVEIVTIRLELSGALPRMPIRWIDPIERRPSPSRRAAVIFDGNSFDSAVFFREALRPGDRITGPALIVESTSTIVVEPDWSAEITGRGDVVLSVSARPPLTKGDRGGTECDPIRLEIFNNQFASIAEQMGNTLRRAALSTNVKERLDFSCALFSASGDLIANAPHIPVHLGAMSECVKRLIDDIPDMSPGDVLVTNDPFRGGSHLPDVTVVTPVYDENGARLFFTASRAHHAEIGGTVPGSMPPNSKRLSEEGVLIRRFKVIERGVSREAELRRVLTEAPLPSRAPEDNLADIRAQIAANRAGANELLSMIAREGRETVLAYMLHIRDAAARKMSAALRRLPEGKHAFTDHMDDGSPIAVSIEVRDGKARVDFDGTGPVVEANFNANRAIVSSALLYCLRCLIDENIPLNSGVLAPVEICLPDCLLNPPAYDDPARCCAMVGGNVETSQRVVDAVFGALGVCAASQGTMNSFAFGNERFGYMETICGGAGAGPGYHGASAVHTHMTNTRLTDPEVFESRYPVRLVRFAIRKGSGGAGQFRGGDGVIREVQFLQPLEVSILSMRRNCAPYGLRGGSAAERGRNLLRRAGSPVEEVLAGRAQFSVKPGDIVTIMTPGGGGYGSKSQPSSVELSLHRPYPFSNSL
jgi:5-oxoprolinase (ATP-hydrolysing)